MTIPQILKSVGWFLFSTSLVFLVLHTVNLAVPYFDAFVKTSPLGMTGYWIAGPVVIVGFVTLMIGQRFEP